MSDAVALRVAWFWYGAGVFSIGQAMLRAEPSVWVGLLFIVTGSTIELVLRDFYDDEDGDQGE